ncbi:PLP-dependent aminotransferase family protein [Opitutia bacterium ISCC 51]|nr:PLP-dependent aminotransferase family protein [Opitutae bacterium ISCC 51]QXD27449.1 PLP-dependent aminotransferase family protein [Opitutae bacterium ISCC 52]
MSSPSIRFSRIGQWAEPPVISEVMKVALENKDLLSLAAGFTDTEALPVKAVRDISVALATSGKPPQYLQYGTTLGRPGLRKFVSKRLSQFDQHQSPDYHPDHVMLTNGSQQALYLAMQVLCDPGDILLVESPSYFVFLELLKGLGIEAVGIPINEDDELDSKGLISLLEGMKANGTDKRVKGIYLESWFSNPSTRCLTNEKKAEVAHILRDAGLMIPILEDGAYQELYFEEPFPSTSVFAIEAFDAFPRLFFGTFTKSFATGLKAGFAICDHPDLLSKMTSVKGHHDFGSSNYAQAILEHAIEQGDYDAQLERGRKRYQLKMEVLHRTLVEEELQKVGWSWQKPDGGLYLWLKGPEGLDTSMEGAFFENAVKEGVLYVPGNLCFAPEGPKNYLRSSYGVLEVDDLVEAGKRLAKVIRQFN